jgi:threonine dehydratase
MIQKSLQHEFHKSLLDKEQTILIPDELVPDHLTEDKLVLSYDDRTRLSSTSYDDLELCGYPAGSKERVEIIRNEKVVNYLHDTAPHTYIALLALERIRDVMRPTPLIDASQLVKTSLNFLIKPEHQQRQRSFKVRGGVNAVASLDPDQFDTIVAVSAGNHAQGVALGALEMHKHAVIVMSRNAAQIKVDNVRELGAEVIQVGATYDEAVVACRSIMHRYPRAKFIHPFENELVMQGNSTLAVETFLDKPDVQSLYVSVGGGGQIALTAAVAKELYGDAIDVVGVQLEGSDAMTQSFAARKLITIDSANQFSDGTAVRRGGERALAHILKHVDRMITVSEQAVAQAMIAVEELTGNPAEAAGALSVAGVRHDEQRLDGTAVALVSGGNVSKESMERIRSFVA